MGTVISISWHVLFVWSLIMMSGLLAFISLSVCTCISHIKVTSSLPKTVSGLCLYHLSVTGRLNALQIFQCMYDADLSGRCMNSDFAKTGYPLTI